MTPEELDKTISWKAVLLILVLCGLGGGLLASQPDVNARTVIALAMQGLGIGLAVVYLGRFFRALLFDQPAHRSSERKRG
jgi:hypothetical protein